MNDVLPLFERRGIEIQNLDMTRKKGGAVKLELLLKYPAGAYLPDVVRDMEAMGRWRRWRCERRETGAALPGPPGQ